MFHVVAVATAIYARASAVASPIDDRTGTRREQTARVARAPKSRRRATRLGRQSLAHPIQRGGGLTAGGVLRPTDAGCNIGTIGESCHCKRSNPIIRAASDVSAPREVDFLSAGFHSTAGPQRPWA